MGKVDHVSIGHREGILISTTVSGFQTTFQAKNGF